MGKKRVFVKLYSHHHSHNYALAHITQIFLILVFSLFFFYL